VNESRRGWLGLGKDKPASAPADTQARDSIRKRYFDPDIVLRTHLGGTVRLYEDLIRDKVVTINYMYVGCSDGTCPITTHNLTRVQKLLRNRVGRDIFMYSITLDPEFDSPKVLKEYARTHGAGPGWLFLTPPAESADLLRRRLGFYDRNPAVDALRSSHASMLRFGNEPKQLWGSISGIAAPEAVERAIRWVAG
jgi:protein SCO1/2